MDCFGHAHCTSVYFLQMKLAYYTGSRNKTDASLLSVFGLIVSFPTIVEEMLLV
uniref:Uncharacterized protein n=1 Tax=Rhizophora mucronata TaxID=61149 RepID=A0A2P2QZJ9_RHIMU